MFGRINNMAILKIEEPEAGLQSGSLMHQPLWALGFRPFYLLAAAFAAIAIPLWVATYLGWFASLPKVTISWHMHEMVFGFVIAVVIGFIFTAGRNWTGLWTPRRSHLAALAGLWLAGRAAMLFAPPLLAALVDLAFLPFAAWPIYRVLQRSGNKRNMFLVGLLGLLTLFNALFHTTQLGWLTLSPVQPVQGAILAVVMIVTVIGGRVIPGFTANGVPGTKPSVLPKLDKIVFSVVGAASLAWILALPSWIVAPLALAAGCLQLQRLSGWQTLRTLRNPLVWILHLSYAWIPLGFLLLGLTTWHIVPTGAAFHALAVGAISGAIVGMITRTALGHTGRPLKAGHTELAMYVLIQVGALARLCASIGPAGVRETTLVIAAACWTSAFLLYLVVYGPYLVRARIDGKEG
jgi:uncharacterized protein involved in response to NO